MSITDLVQTIAAAATAIGVGLAAVQLYLSRVQARSDFEDSLAREYRELIQRIPVDALLGHELTDEQLRKSLSEFHHYFTLSNDQVFLRQQARVTARTWRDWCLGIAANMRRPAFIAAWELIAGDKGTSFCELRRLKQDRYNVDPRAWGRK